MRASSVQIGVASTAILLLLAVVTTACAGSAIGTGRPQPPSATASEADDPVAGFIADLEAAGTPVTRLGPFNPEPLADEGVRLCVDGQAVSVYVYQTSDARAAVAANIARTDPSNVGTAIIEWRGDPTFWQRDRLIVLYLGRDPATETTLSSVMGGPFATGRGRHPGPGGHSC